MQIHVEVMQDDIEHGKRGSASRCPVARALMRTTGQAWFVTYSLAASAYGRQVREIALGEELSAWIQRFDVLGFRPRRWFGLIPATCRPFSFDLDVPYSVTAEAERIADALLNPIEAQS